MAWRLVTSKTARSNATRYRTLQIAYVDGHWDIEVEHWSAGENVYFNGLIFSSGVTQIKVVIDYIHSTSPDQHTPRTYEHIHSISSNKDFVEPNAVATKLDTDYTVKVYEDYTPNPPSPPSSITVPSQVKEGESINISWGSGSGATRYYLYRSVNGGSYTQVYSGSSRSYTETAQKTWDTVRYRVRSYNVDGYSSYRYSDIIIITHFPEMKLKVDGTLKTSEMGWVKVDGVLREIDSIYTKVDGLLKEVK